MESLSDPLGDRVVRTLVPPPHQPIGGYLLFNDGNVYTEGIPN